MYVITADQHASQRRGDLVPELVAGLAEAPDLSTVLPFERTVGDEVQGVLGSAEAVIAALARLHRYGRWAVGIGVGPVEELGEGAAASRGPVFVAARRAVERARSKAVPVPMAVEWTVARRRVVVAHCESLGQLLASVQRRRTCAGWQVIDLLPGRTQAAVATQIGVSAAAVSQRLRTARWAEVAAVEPLLGELLVTAHDEATPPEGAS